MKSLMMSSDLSNRKNYNNKMRSQHNMSKIQPALIIKKSKRHLILSTLWLRRDNHGLILILDRQVLQFTFLENNHYPQETTTPGNVLVIYTKTFMCTQIMSSRLTSTRESWVTAISLLCLVHWQKFQKEFKKESLLERLIVLVFILLHFL